MTTAPDQPTPPTTVPLPLDDPAPGEDPGVPPEAPEEQEPATVPL